jgi:hypothetical protein
VQLPAVAKVQVDHLWELVYLRASKPVVARKRWVRLAIKPSVWAAILQGGTMNQTILKIAGIIAIILGSVALFLTGIGESAVIAIVSAVFVLSGLIMALFKPKGAEAPDFGTKWIEIIAIDTRTREAAIIGTVDADRLKSLSMYL